MQSLQKEFKFLLCEAEQQLISAKNLSEILYPSLNDSKILLKALQQITKAETTLITLALKREYIQKRIRLATDPQKNKEIFFKKSAKRYGLQKNQQDILRQLLILGENYKKSGCTFPQKEKAIILNDDGTFNEITPLIIKRGLFVLQNLIKALKTESANSRKL